MVEAHVGTGEFEEARCFAYVYLEHAVHYPHLFIRKAMELAAGAPAFKLAASARGAGLMIFDTPEERDEIIAMSPIAHDGNRLTLEKHEEADNRFFAFYRLYAEIAASDFPLEHWTMDRAREALGAVGSVCCLDPMCFEGGDYTSIRAVVRLDHQQELPDQLLVRNHDGPACLANIHAICTWVDVGPETDWGGYTFNATPAIHEAPYYHPVGNPLTQLPQAPENLVATVLEWDHIIPTPPLRPVRTRCPTPYPGKRAPLALPWYGVGGVPEQAKIGAEGAPGGAIEQDKVVGKQVVAESEDEGVVTAADELAALELVEQADKEQERRAKKRRARRRKAKESARALRRGLRLQEKEGAPGGQGGSRSGGKV
jgi:hypothetical protein